MESQQFCTFFLSGYLFGVPVPQVQEVIRFQPMTPVPLAPAAVRGMINLRGQIVLAIDLRLRLCLGELYEGERPTNVVVRTPDGASRNPSRPAAPDDFRSAQTRRPFITRARCGKSLSGTRQGGSVFGIGLCSRPL